MIRFALGIAMALGIVGGAEAASKDAKAPVEKGAASPLAPVKLALNWKPEAEFGGFYEAERAGHYAKAGFKVEILPGGVGTPVVQMIAAGQTDFGIVSASEIVLARSRGADVVGVFSVYQDSPHAILVHESRGFKSLADVFRSEGTLAIEMGSPMALHMEKKYAPVKVKRVPYAGGISHFLRDATHSQQGFVTSESLLAAQQGAKVKSFLVKDSGYNPYLVLVAVKGELWRKEPEKVKAFLRATREGWKAFNAAPAPANAIMRKLNPTIDEKTFAESAVVQRPFVENEFTKAKGLGAMTRERWAELIAQLKDLGSLKVSDQVKPEECFTNEAL